MVIAALIAFAGLLAAWLLAPAEPLARTVSEQLPAAVEPHAAVAEAA